MNRILAMLLFVTMITTSLQITVDAETISEEIIVETNDETTEEELLTDSNENLILEDEDLTEIEEIIFENDDISKVKNPRSSEDVITWDCVYFGNYWQNDTNNDGFANTDDAKLPIKWRVLAVNGTDAFLVADQNLDCQEYNTSITSVTWETCTLRSWLNGYGSSKNTCGTDYSGSGSSFISNAFSSDEQSAIIQTNLENADNPEYGTEGGENTSDKVFLLSYDDVVNNTYGFSADYIYYDEARYAKNTVFAKDERGADTYYGGSYDGNGWWYLRSPGYRSHSAMYVTSLGHVYRLGESVGGKFAVRPALHLNLSSDSWSYAGVVTAEGNIGELNPTNPSDQGYVEKKFKPSATEYVINLATKEKYSVPELMKTNEDGKNYYISYNSKMDSKYASMTPKGLISAKKPGTSNIILKKGATEYRITVNVYDPKFIYTNTKQKYFTVNTGEKITPAYENCKLKPTFSLDNSSIKKGLATINAETGEVTPLKKGNIKVTATVGEGKNGRKVTTTIKIFDPVLYVGKNNTVIVGKQLKATVKDDVKISTDWKSSNEAIATVDNAGKIKGVSAGTVTISCVNNGKLISKDVTVVENANAKK